MKVFFSVVNIQPHIANVIPHMEGKWQIDIPVMKGRKSFFKLYHIQPSITVSPIYGLSWIHSRYWPYSSSTKMKHGDGLTLTARKPYNIYKCMLSVHREQFSLNIINSIHLMQWVYYGKIHKIKLNAHVL